MNPKIIGIGIATIDHLYLLEDVAELPEGNVLDHSVQGGGMAATAMAASARLGAPSAAVLCVGEDQRGDEVIRGLEKCGVETSSVRTKPGATPMVTVLVDAGDAERHFLPLRCDSPRPGPDDVDWDLAGEANVFLVDSWTREPGRLLQRARSMELTTMVDKECEPGEDPEWVTDVNVYIGGGDQAEWRDFPDRAIAEAERIVSMGPHTAILTLGEAGCVGMGPEGEFRVPGYSVEVVDTCGAGDVFRGGYAWALEQGWRARHCAAFAGATSALSVTELGGRAGLPGVTEVVDLLVNDGIEGPWESIDPDAARGPDSADN